MSYQQNVCKGSSQCDISMVMTAVHVSPGSRSLQWMHLVQVGVAVTRKTLNSKMHVSQKSVTLDARMWDSFNKWEAHIKNDQYPGIVTVSWPKYSSGSAWIPSWTRFANGQT